MSDSPRVLLVSCGSPGSATSRYRCEHLARLLEVADAAKAEVVYVGQSRIRVDHDLVVLHSVPMSGEGRRLFAAARRCGARVIYSVDDLVFDEAAARGMAAVWQEHADGPIARYRLRKLIRNGPHHRAMLVACDAAMVSTDFLADRLRAAGGGTVRTIRNFLDDDMLALADAAVRNRDVSPGERHAPRVTLAYLAGTATHDADLATIAAPMSEVLERFPAADMLLVGPVRVPPRLAALAVAGRIRRLPFVHWRELPALLAREVDVNLAPLDLTHPFNHAKSEIKFLEAAAVRLPTVAAASAAMREAVGDVRSDTGALLAANEGDWVKHLSALLEFSDRRIALGQAAYDHLLRTGTANAHLPSVAAWFQDAVQGMDTRRGALPPSGSWVNWPLAPPKYAARALVERMEGRRASVARGDRR
jgi:glycosyltransferase involved in cell wall biosynthesis